jgi:hypothetical protein
MTERPATGRAWFVKYDGVCARCGTPLVRGVPAVWDRSSKTIHCIECPNLASEAEVLPIDVGLAGGSSRREYERRVAKRDAAIDERWGTGRMGRLVHLVTTEPRSTRAWAIGAWGEETLAAELAIVPGLQSLHDRRVRGTRGNIDHIVIAPAGIFVVDAKHYKGLIRIQDRGRFLRHDYRLTVGGRDRTRLTEAMAWQVEAVANALLEAGEDPLPSITPVLCFVNGDWPIIRRPEEFNGVRIASERSIRKLLTETASLDPDAILRLTRALATELPSKTQP